MNTQKNKILRVFASALLVSALSLSTLPYGEEVLKAEASERTWNFDYTGNYQTWTVPQSGKYKLETWGASGGRTDHATQTTNKGGYSKGEINLTAGQTIYIYVGGAGQRGPTGGFNGGGSGYNWSSDSAGGGGGTDIRLNSTSLNNRVIVAGGAGGNGCTADVGGAGGGVNGIAGVGTNYNSPGSGGTQTTGGQHGGGYATSGSLGLGGNVTAGYGGGGGGGGYFGGGAGGTESGGGNAGGGGSGYIGGVQNGQSIAGNQSFSSPSGGTEVGHEGHGYAKITSLNSAPLVNVATPTNNVQLNPGVTVNLTGTINDPDNRGTMYVKYAIDNGTPVQLSSLTGTSLNQNFNTSVSIPSNLSIGNHTLSVWGEDNEGGIGEKQNITFTVRDIINPTMSLVLSTTAWTSGSIVIQANATDNQAIKRIKLPDGNYVNASTASYTVTTNGTYTFVAEDMSGNTVTQSINVSNKDNVPPTATGASVENVNKDGYDVVVRGVSDNASGISRVMFPTWTEANGQDDIAPDWTKNTTLKGTDEGNGVWRFHVDRTVHKNEFGEYITHIYLIDNAGNEGTMSVRAFLDGVAPTLNIISSTNDWVSSTVSLRATASDDGSGIKRMQLPDGNWVTDSSTSYTVNANGTYTFAVEDNFGNITTKSFSVSNLDKTKPTVSHSLNNSDLTTDEVVVNVNASDSQSGVKSMIDVDKMENGLTGTYRKHEFPAIQSPPIDLGSTVFQRTDEKIEFNWGSGSPDPRLDADGYNVTWTGYVKAPVTGEVSFETNTDDGARLKVGNNLLVDIWAEQSATKHQGSISMVKGEWYPITMEYFENGGTSLAELRWSHDNTSGFEIIPKSAFYTGGKTDGSRLFKTVSRNGDYEFLAIDNVGNTQRYQVKISNLIYKPELHVEANHKDDYVSLDWSIADKWQSYRYMIYKKARGENEYKPVSTEGTRWDDHTSKDIHAPDSPVIQRVTTQTFENKVNFNFSPVNDKGSSYDYYVEATGIKNGAKTNSDEKSTTVLSGLKGYSYVIDNSPNTIPDNEVDTTNTNLTVNKEINGNFYVHVVAIDNVGNVSKASHYHFEDTGAPILNVDLSPTSWTNGRVLLTAIASDNETGIRHIQLPNGDIVNGGIGNYDVESNGIYSFVAEDLSGNRTTKEITVSNIDKTAPTSPTITNNESWVKVDSVTVTIQSGSDNASGVAYTEYRMSGATNSGWTRYNGTFQVSNEGETFILARTVDKVGIVSSESASMVRIDRSTPHNTGITIKLKP